MNLSGPILHQLLLTHRLVTQVMTNNTIKIRVVPILEVVEEVEVGDLEQQDLKQRVETGNSVPKHIHRQTFNGNIWTRWTTLILTG